LENSDFNVINGAFQTRVTANCSSSPDLTIVSHDLLASTTWQVKTALNSDHLPIITTVSRKPDFITSQNKTFVNFSKANWDRFTALSEREFRTLPPPTSANIGEKNI
jgi:hypothetical protein